MLKFFIEIFNFKFEVLIILILRIYFEEYELSNFNVFGDDIYLVILDIIFYKIFVDICYLYRYIRDLNYKFISDLYKLSFILFFIF